MRFKQEALLSPDFFFLQQNVYRLINKFLKWYFFFSTYNIAFSAFCFSFLVSFCSVYLFVGSTINLRLVQIAGRWRWSKKVCEIKSDEENWKVKSCFLKSYVALPLFTVHDPKKGKCFTAVLFKNYFLPNRYEKGYALFWYYD